MRNFTDNMNEKVFFLIRISQRIASLYRKNDVFLIVKNGGIYSNHLDIKSESMRIFTDKMNDNWLFFK